MLSITFFAHVTLLNSGYRVFAIFWLFFKPTEFHRNGSRLACSRFFFASSILRAITSRFVTIGFVPRSVSKNRHNLIRLLCPVRNFWVYDTSAFHRRNGKPNFPTSSNKSCFTSTKFEITGNALPVEKMIRSRESD